jgi:hypothetical protein
MFPPTLDSLAAMAGVHHPIREASPGGTWLVATAARAAQIEQQLAEGHHHASLVTLHAHYAVEDPRHDPRKVAADLRVPVRRQRPGQGCGFAAEVALFRVARDLLDGLTAIDLAERTCDAA